MSQRFLQMNPRLDVYLLTLFRTLSTQCRRRKIVDLQYESQQEVSISVRDTGFGIPQDVMEKIWTPLYTTKAKGIGLGLPICKRIIEAHGGSISVESTVGKGTTFTLKLPIQPSRPEVNHYE